MNKNKMSEYIENAFYGAVLGTGMLTPYVFAFLLYLNADVIGKILVLIFTILGSIVISLIFASGYMNEKIDTELQENYELWKDEDYPAV